MRSCLILISVLSLLLSPAFTGSLLAEANDSEEKQEAKQEPSASLQLGQRIVDQALTYCGMRYRLGGNGTRTVDCAGLVVKVWADLGLEKLPGNCLGLYKLGRYIGPEEAQPGDLLFFENTYRRGISHVGIYIGNNEFIHASRRRGVAISKLTDPYYFNHIVGGRRLHE